jgi:pilus assembly protein CpaE
MRILIASDQSRQSERVQEILARMGVDCPAGPDVPLELAADRASRLLPDVLILSLPDEPAVGLDAIREAKCTVPNVYTLVVGPATDPKLILQALHVGADEFLDGAILDTELVDALQRFKTREASPPERVTPGRVISVMAPSGGSGSSTVAANVATVLAGKAGQCGLVDLRLTAGDLASMLDLRPTHNIADLCDHLGRLDQCLFEQFFVLHASGVSLLAAPTEFADAQRVTGRGVRRALALARVRYPYVVMDLDQHFGEPQVEALWQSDVIVLVMRLDYTSVRNTRRVLDNLVKLGLGTDRVRPIVNGYGQRRQLSVAQAETALGMKIVHYIPNDPAVVNQSVNKGVPVVLQYPRAKVSRRLHELAASVNGRVTASKH